LNATLAKVDGIMTNLSSGKGSMGKLLNDDAFIKTLKALLKN
jgi:phospholipid/cholesterol/gamma-HCH transport system substrate-binding protein